MKVRSITSFYDPGAASADADLQVLARLSGQLQEKISREVMPVQSTRLATVPFPAYLPIKDNESSVGQVTSLEEKTLKMGWSYLSIGPALPRFPSSYPLIPSLLASTRKVFASAIISDEQFLYPAAARIAAEVIHLNSAIEKDGFANLRFAALANVPANAPFLPAAYHQSAKPLTISFAMECADVVLEAFQVDRPLEESQRVLLKELEQSAERITKIFHSLVGDARIDLAGFDFSPAPFPVDECSLGAGVEAVGVEHIGGFGSLAPVALVADTLDHGTWKKVGFNGMMLPLLEDSRLSTRSLEGLLDVKDLLLYSTVCGTGLDTIPLSGNTTVEQLNSVLMDIATLATRLSKPLTARLLPIPGKQAGDITDFQFEFFSRARVLAINGQKMDLNRFGETPIRLSPRNLRI